MKKIILDKDFLYKEYIIKNNSMQYIASLVNCSASCIKTNLIEYNIPIKSKSDRIKGKNNGMFGKHQTEEAKQKISKKMEGINNPQFGKRRLDVSERNRLFPPFKGKVRLNFRGINHPFFGKKRPDHSLRMSGSNHPNFGKSLSIATRKKQSLSHGGTGIPYENNNYPEEYFRIRPKIRKRDNYQCQLCGKKFNKYSIGLDCHHIDYNKRNNNINNLICLCERCHNQTKFNRLDWKISFIHLMIDRKL